MTDQQKHVARLREMAAASRTKADKFKIHNVGEWFDKYMAEADTFDAGAEALEALEAQGGVESRSLSRAELPDTRRTRGRMANVRR